MADRAKDGVPFLAAFKCFFINFEWINFNPFISTLFSTRVNWRIIYRGTTDNRTSNWQPGTSPVPCPKYFIEKVWCLRPDLGLAIHVRKHLDRAVAGKLPHETRPWI